MEIHPEKVQQIRDGQTGKVKFLVGQIMRMGHGNVIALKAEAALTAELLPMDDDKGKGSR